jgi:pentatricopeptide repeat protein
MANQVSADDETSFLHMCSLLEKFDDPNPFGESSDNADSNSNNNNNDDGMENIPKALTYKNVLKVLSDSNSVDVAFKWFISMVKSDSPPDLLTFSKVICLLGYAGRHQEALDCYQTMLKMKQKPDIMIYNTIIKIYGILGETEKALNTYYELVNNSKRERDGGDGERKGVEGTDTLAKPDVYTYSTMIKLLSDANRVPDAVRCYNSMKEFNVIPDTVTYNTMIKLYGESGQVDQALACYKVMILPTSLGDKNGKSRCIPTTVTYNGLIKLLGLAGRIGMYMYVYLYYLYVLYL